jgi:penicillin-insensitive murein endopeptidase
MFGQLKQRRRPAIPVVTVALGVLLVSATGATAQDIGTLNPKPLPPLANPDDPATPAKELFARKTTPTTGAPRAIGFYSAGCLSGGVALPIDGPSWQVMRLSRNRNWGHPDLLRFLEGLGSEVNAAKTWNGLLIGDMSQPRGGPMITGHASHQVGLDADIWLTPMPARQLTRAEREEMMSTILVAKNRLDVDASHWKPGHREVIKTAALDPHVERLFVNPAIKKALCREASGDHGWLEKVRPYWGHDYHFHVRLHCPADAAQCKPQEPPPVGDGCEKDLAWWFPGGIPRPETSTATEKPRGPLTVAELPAACREVLEAP